MSNEPQSYAAVAARGSPTSTSNPSPPPPQGDAQASYTKAKPDDKKRKDAPPGYGAQGTFPVHPYPDVEVYPSTTNGGNYSRNGGPPPPQNGQQHNNNGYVAMGRHQPPTWLRFLRSLGVAVLIYLLASLLVESIYLAASWGAGRRRDHLPGNYNVPPDVKLYHCASSDTWKKVSRSDSSAVSTAPDTYPYAVETSFDLPLDVEEALVVLSRGPWLSGDVNIVTGANKEKDMVSVNVLVRYSRQEVRDEVRACLVEREDGGEGVGIFTPDHRGDWGTGRDHHVHYETTLVLPEGATPLLLKKLETDVPNSSHHLTLDGTKVQFEDVSLRGSNGRININALTAQQATIRARNSPVTGSFNVTKELTIETSNARIEAAVIMQHVNKLNNAPKLDIKTSNAVLHTDILLVSDAFPFPSFEARSAPHYEVKTSTTNSRLDVSFTGAPTDAVLHFEGSTENGAASAQLYPTYSGSYEIKTSNSAADLRISCPGVGPESKNKRCEGGMTVVREEIVKKNYLKGELEWKPVVLSQKEKGGDKKLESTVVLTASNAPAVLNV